MLITASRSFRSGGGSGRQLSKAHGGLGPVPARSRGVDAPLHWKHYYQAVLLIPAALLILAPFTGPPSTVKRRPFFATVVLNHTGGREAVLMAFLSLGKICLMFVGIGSRARRWSCAGLRIVLRG